MSYKKKLLKKVFGYLNSQDDFGSRDFEREKRMMRNLKPNDVTITWLFEDLGEKRKKLIEYHKCKNCYWYVETEKEKGVCERDSYPIVKIPDAKCRYFYSEKYGSFKDVIGDY